MKISSETFGRMPTGEEVQRFSLSNNQEVQIEITNYGGIIVAVNVPDRDGKLGDVVLGHDSLEGYLSRSRYFGALVGRYANRIAQGRFQLDGVEYKLATNNGPNHLHGGLRGFDKVVWNANAREEDLQLSYLSRDGEEGYPGNLRVEIKYSLTDANELRIEYSATTDKDTILNLTNHSYFNLAGAGTVLDHMMTIHADAFTPVDNTLIPTGQLRESAGTPMDFSSPTAIGARINADDEQLRNAGGGYDHNFVLRKSAEKLRIAAEVYHPESGRVLEVSTTQPGLQFYSGNFLNGAIVGKNGRAYVKHSGFCLETQHFPDSPNHQHFPSTILRPGEQYHHVTMFKFSVC